MKKLLSVLMMVLYLTSFSQVVPNKDWVVQITNGGIDIHGIAAAVDYTSGAVYSCGYMNTVSNGQDIVVVKLDSNGVQLWSATYNYTVANLDDKANAICVDPSGNVYVTGYSQAASNNADIIVIKYNSSGTQQWATRLTGNANSDDCGNSIGVDGSGNVYVAGYATITGKGKDFSVSKLNSSGVHQGTLKLNGSANSDDAAEKLTIDGSNLFATGSIKNTSTNKDVLTICVATSGPSVTWSTTVNGSTSSDDTGLDVKTYGSDVYICGKTNNTTTGEDYYFAKMAQSNGAIGYSNTYDGGYNGSDFATSLVSDNIGDFGITGIVTNGSNIEYHTQVYSTSALQWTHIQPQNGNYTTIYPKIAVDTIAYHYYVCGAYFNGTQDAILYQVDPSGVKRWTQYHNGTGNARDIHADLAVNGLGQIYVASANETGTSSNSYDYDIIRYSQTPVYMPCNYNMRKDTFSFSNLYYQNSGEIIDTTGAVANDVLFYTKYTYPNQFILKNKVAFCEFKPDSMFAVNRTDSVSRVDMSFVGANEFSEVFPFYFQDDSKLNYFMSYTGSGITDVKGAGNLLVPNIYNLIDLHITSNAYGSKYFFVVKPGGDPSNIQLKFDGATSTATISNNLKITSSLGNWTFKKPDIYNVSVPSFTNLTITTTSITGTTGWVSLGSDTYSINPGSYNTAWPLVIEFDMGKTAAISSYTDNLRWSTYFGGGSNDQIYDVKCDRFNNIYVVGYTASGNFPFVTGPSIYQNSNGGSSDGVIVKFDYLGKHKWTSYFGGMGSELATSLDISPATGRIFLVGQTNSTLTTISKGGATNTTTKPGGVDGFVFELSSAGNPAYWLSYYGGSNDDTPNKCQFDANANLFVVGTTNSNNIPIVGSSPQYTYTNTDGSSSNTEGFIVRYNSSSSITWATFLGSSNTDDKLWSLDFDSNNDVFICGETYGNFPIYWTNSNQTHITHLGTLNDALITRFSNTGQIKWGTCYGGPYGFDYGFDVKVKSGRTYLFGAAGSTNIPTPDFGSWYYQGTKAGGQYDAFLAIFDSSKDSLIHGTYIGGSGYDVGARMVIDSVDHIYMTGYTDGTNFALPFGAQPAGTYTTTNKGGFDYFIAGVYEGSTDLTWSTEFGGTNTNENATGLAMDHRNNLFLVGGSQSDTGFPLWGESGVPYFDSTFNGIGTYDGTIAKFNLSPINFVGIKPNGAIASGVFVFPNPTQSYINIRRDDFKTRSNFTIFNAMGQVVMQGTLDGEVDLINLSNLSVGMYILEIKEKTKKSTAKFIKYD
jgi:hypothetical protein